MNSRFLVWAFCSVVTVCSQVLADGLIYELPPDGSWASYQMKYRISELTSLDGEPMSPSAAILKGVLTLRSVGTQETTDGPGRWIELESNGPPTNEFPGRIIVLKMLIPEKYLTAGHDPLARVEVIYFWSRDWELNHEPENGVKEELNDKGRILYEVERFRPHFPYPSENVASIETTRDQTAATPHGTHKATKIAYPMRFSGKLSGGMSGHWRWSGTHTLWLTGASPFGVAAIETEYSQVEEYETKSSKTDEYELNGDGVRAKCKLSLRLVAVGTGARSVLTDYPIQDCKREKLK